MFCIRTYTVYYYSNTVKSCTIYKLCMLLSYEQFNKFFRDKFNFIFAVRTDILESDLIFIFFK